MADDGPAVDGAAPSGNVAASTGSVLGGRGADVLLGNERAQTLWGGIEGGTGADVIRALGGDDRVSLYGGRIEAGDGDDEIDARPSDGPVTIDAGAGADTIFAIVYEVTQPVDIDAGDGDDRIEAGSYAPSAQPLRVACGSGDDRVDVPRGSTDVTVAADCETVVRG